jgi:hypothetical protein
VTDPTREEALAHFGVKGQKWGVRNEDKLVGQDPAKKAETGSDKAKQNELTKQYMAIKPPKVSKEKDAQMHAESKAKFKAKFESNDAKSGEGSLKEWRPTKKQVATVAVGAAAVGLLIYGVKSGKLDSAGKSYMDTVAKWTGGPGDPIAPGAFNLNVTKSAATSWGAKGYIQPSSFAHEGSTFPVGHVFHRLTTSSETGFRQAGTYCTDSVDDFNRYVTAFRKELYSNELHHVTFKAKQEIKVPGLTDTLESLRRSLGTDATPEDAHSWYNRLSGGGWDKSDPVVSNFFKELTKNGYHAIVDEMDAGVIGERPLVFFDHKAVTKKTAELMTSEGIKAAEAALTEISNRK